MTLRFEEPPARPGRPPLKWGAHREIAQELRSRPREWAVVETYETSPRASAMAYAMRRATLTAYGPPGAFEAAARTVEGEHRVYARFVGESDE